MIKKAANMTVEVHDQFLGGKGTLTNIHFLKQADSAGTGRLFAKSILKPGSSIGYHTHNGDCETYYILAGKALVSDNGNQYVLEAGDSMHTPDGASHSIKNIGETDLEYIALILFTKYCE